MATQCEVKKAWKEAVDDKNSPTGKLKQAAGCIVPMRETTVRLPVPPKDLGNERIHLFPMRYVSLPNQAGLAYNTVNTVRNRSLSRISINDSVEHLELFHQKYMPLPTGYLYVYVEDRQGKNNRIDEYRIEREGNKLLYRINLQRDFEKIEDKVQETEFVPGHFALPYLSYSKADNIKAHFSYERWSTEQYVLSSIAYSKSPLFGDSICLNHLPNKTNDAHPQEIEEPLFTELDYMDYHMRPVQRDESDKVQCPEFVYGFCEEELSARKERLLVGKDALGLEDSEIDNDLILSALFDVAYIDHEEMVADIEKGQSIEQEEGISADWFYLGINEPMINVQEMLLESAQIQLNMEKRREQSESKKGLVYALLNQFIDLSKAPRQAMCGQTVESLKLVNDMMHHIESISSSSPEDYLSRQVLDEWQKGNLITLKKNLYHTDRRGMKGAKNELVNTAKKYFVSNLHHYSIQHKHIIISDEVKSESLTFSPLNHSLLREFSVSNGRNKEAFNNLLDSRKELDWTAFCQDAQEVLPFDEQYHSPLYATHKQGKLALKKGEQADFLSDCWLTFDFQAIDSIPTHTLAYVHKILLMDMIKVIRSEKNSYLEQSQHLETQETFTPALNRFALGLIPSLDTKLAQALNLDYNHPNSVIELSLSGGSLRLYRELSAMKIDNDTLSQLIEYEEIRNDEDKLIEAVKQKKASEEVIEAIKSVQDVGLKPLVAVFGPLFKTTYGVKTYIKVLKIKQTEKVSTPIPMTAKGTNGLMLRYAFERTVEVEKTTKVREFLAKQGKLSNLEDWKAFAKLNNIAGKSNAYLTRFFLVHRLSDALNKPNIDGVEVSVIWMHIIKEGVDIVGGIQDAQLAKTMNLANSGASVLNKGYLARQGLKRSFLAVFALAMELSISAPKAYSDPSIKNVTKAMVDASGAGVALAGVFIGGPITIIGGVVVLVAGLAHSMIFAALRDFVLLLQRTPWGKEAMRLPWQYGHGADEQAQIKQKELSDYFSGVYYGMYHAPIELKKADPPKHSYHYAYNTQEDPRYARVEIKVPILLVEQGIYLMGLYERSQIKDENTQLESEKVPFKVLSTESKNGYYVYQLEVYQSYPMSNTSYGGMTPDTSNPIFPNLVLTTKGSEEENGFEVKHFVGEMNRVSLNIASLLRQFGEYYQGIERIDVIEVPVDDEFAESTESSRSAEGAEGAKSAEEIIILKGDKQYRIRSSHPKPRLPLNEIYDRLKWRHFEEKAGDKEKRAPILKAIEKGIRLPRPKEEQ